MTETTGRRYTKTVAVPFTAEQYELIKQAAVADQRPVASLIRVWVMERVTP
jgi:hypothetical protein